jgi:ABC-type lipoprotein export system ATPase subunit
MLFEIRDLECTYGKPVPVLTIPYLDIPSGKLIFIIGRSGIGKSTLVETLGLMNRTTSATNSSKIVFFANESEKLDISNYWSKSNHDISAFRKKHFSFIFQSTNLMPNFSAGENMMISLLIKGHHLDEAKNEVMKVMDRLALGPEVFNKRITELSGGQRQRLAFVRAITADFSVLFGDEPTGNLDRNTSEELMRTLKEQLVSGRSRSAILVSHDLLLALEFADLIIPISTRYNSDESAVGLVQQENVIMRDGLQWIDNKGVNLGDPLLYLNSFLSR